MKIESNSAQIIVEDSDAFAGVNINRVIGGFASDLCFWGGETYVAKREGDLFLHLLTVPSIRWLEDLKNEGWIIIGTLTDLTKDKK